MYDVADLSNLLSPSLVLLHEVMESNLAEMIRVAGDPARLRPHCKTHKMSRVTEFELTLGITKHKCATFAEADMLARAGAKDIVLAYNPVGPNVKRTIDFVQQWPDVQFAVTADHAGPIRTLNDAARNANIQLSVLLDIDTGMHRTGVLSLEMARSLYGTIHNATNLVAAGLHVYDGQNHQTDLAERTHAVNSAWQAVDYVRERMIESDMPVPRIVVGGTGSFPIFAAMNDPAIELSPGTPVLYDAGYTRMFPDLNFKPAALILTRVISKPGEGKLNLLALDAGNKSVGADPALEHRIVFPELGEVEFVAHNEEHLVIRTPEADAFSPGDELLAIPGHICPTSALHEEVYVVKNGRVVDSWKVDARHRR